MLPDRAFFHALADAAKAETLPRFRTGAYVTNKLEGGFDPVTEGDRAAESAIRALIGERFPEHGILGEEHDDVGLDREHIWVIDPIDGTRAFISGVPMWGTLIGLQSGGRSTMGLLDQPFTGERYFADGKRSWYSGPDGERQIETRACENLSDAILFTTSPHIFVGEEINRYQAVERNVRLFRYGTDCYAYALLASGHVDLVIESALKPYDVGALIPLIEQAGGVITTWNGGRPEGGGNIIAAGSKVLHGKAMEILNA
jgi:histidinol phosphatase-like enzyme (inositol monophosphatase family)